MNSKSKGVLQVHAIILNSSLKILACVGMLEKNPALSKMSATQLL